MTWLRAALLSLVALLCASGLGPQPLEAQEEPSVVTGEPPRMAEPPPTTPAGASAHPGDRLTVWVLTFTPGTHPFYKFGHNAILIRDPEKKNLQRDKVYNYGTFSFGDPALIPKFFVGRFMYWLSWQSISSTLVAYRREGRGIDKQELDLDGPTKLELQRLLEENLKPENKHYKYDYYRDNCSTRVRDMLDKVLGGRIKQQTDRPGRLTYRQHTLRLTESLPPEYVILHLVMGDLIDKPTTVWDEGFIPMELQKQLRDITIVGPDGQERPLVKSEQTILRAKHPAPPEDPPTTWFYSMLAGLAFGGLFHQLGRKAPDTRGARLALGALLSFFGLVWGFFGWFFLAAWAFTDHAVGYGNENVLLCVPWAIVLVGSGIGVARGRAKSILRAQFLTMLALLSTVVATGLKVVPIFDQDNYFFLLFFLPFWGGAFVSLGPLVKRTAEAPATKPAPKQEGEAKPKAAAKKKTKPKAAAKPERAEPEPAAAEADAGRGAPDEDAPTSAKKGALDSAAARPDEDGPEEGAADEDAPAPATEGTEPATDQDDDAGEPEKK